MPKYVGRAFENEEIPFYRFHMYTEDVLHAFSYDNASCFDFSLLLGKYYIQRALLHLFDRYRACIGYI